MPSLKELRKRIDSVKSTRKITSATKMVAASKLRRAQEWAEAARPFAQHMGRVMASVASGMPRTDDMPRLMVGTGKDQTVLVVIITSDRGLCGALNTNLVRIARRRINAMLAEGKQVKILPVGRKGRDALRRDHGARLLSAPDTSKMRRITYADAQGIAEQITTMFDAGEFDRAVIFYNTFKSVIAQVPTEKQLIPVAIPEGGGTKLEGDAAYDAEPDESEILVELLPRNLAVQVLNAMLENNASFQGAQMSAMDAATRNAGEMIGRLTLQYNRARQASITKELIEIISGAEAV
jgi:F-type H+-transporting ATPase subunit gamma